MGQLKHEVWQKQSGELPKIDSRRFYSMTACPGAERIDSLGVLESGSRVPLPLETVIGRVRHDAISRSQQEWNQPQTFKIDLSWAGLKAECLKCHAVRVVWSYLGIVGYKPTFRFACECGNEATRGILNATSGHSTD